MIAPQIARAFGLLAASSAIAALSACGGDVVVNGGAGAGGLPAAPEVRLGADGAGGTARGAAAWRVFGHGAGSGYNRVDPFFAGKDLARLSPAHAEMVDAARNGPDAVDFDLGLNSADQFTYSASWSGSTSEGWRVNSEEANASFTHVNNKGSSSQRTAETDVKRWASGGGWAAALLTASPSGGDFPRSSDGRLQVAVTTDATIYRSGGLASDWLATGLWAWVPADGAAAGHRFGVFADGGEPVGNYCCGWNIIAGLSGTATYAGTASGVWSSVSLIGTRQNRFFEARATLTADFDADADDPRDGYGTLSGQVSGFTSGGQALAGNPTMTLGQAAIGKFTDGAGYATEGETSMSFGGIGYRGVWEGRFFGSQSPSRDGGRPRQVAGTFGASTGGATFLGAFAAQRSGE